MNFHNFFTIYVFEVGESIADTPTKLTCLSDLAELICDVKFAIRIFDISIGFGDMAERLNHYVGMFRLLGCFSTLLPPHTKIQNLSTTKSNEYSFGGFVKFG